MSYAADKRQRRERANRCRHNLVLCSQCIVVTDAARRMSDIVAEKLQITNSWDIRNCWLAFRLDDGSSDRVLYDTKADAIRHCSDEKYFAFFCYRNAPAGINARDAQIFLNLHRHAYDNGGHLADPDAKSGGPDLIVPVAAHDHMLGRASRLALTGPRPDRTSRSGLILPPGFGGG